MHEGQAVRVLCTEGGTLTVEVEGIIYRYGLRPMDDDHREHGGVDAGQAFTVRRDAAPGEDVEVEVWGCGCRFVLEAQAPMAR